MTWTWLPVVHELLKKNSPSLFFTCCVHQRALCFPNPGTSSVVPQQSHVYQASWVSFCLCGGWGWCHESRKLVLGERGECWGTQHTTAAPAQFAPWKSPSWWNAATQQHTARERLGQPGVSPAAHGETCRQKHPCFSQSHHDNSIQNIKSSLKHYTVVFILWRDTVKKSFFRGFKNCFPIKVKLFFFQNGSFKTLNPFRNLFCGAARDCLAYSGSSQGVLRSITIEVKWIKHNIFLTLNEDQQSTETLSEQKLNLRPKFFCWNFRN